MSAGALTYLNTLPPPLERPILGTLPGQPQAFGRSPSRQRCSPSVGAFSEGSLHELNGLATLARKQEPALGQVPSRVTCPDSVTGR